MQAVYHQKGRKCMREITVSLGIGKVAIEGRRVIIEREA